MATKNRVEYAMAWNGPGAATREAIFELVKNPQPGETRGRLWLAVDSVEEADELLAAVERWRAGQVKKGAKEKAPPPPPAPAGRVNLGSTVLSSQAAGTPSGVTVGVAAAATAPDSLPLPEPAPHPADAAGSIADFPDRQPQPPLRPVEPLDAAKPKLAAVPPPADSTATASALARANQIRSEIPAAVLEGWNVKDAVVWLGDHGVADPVALAAACDHLRPVAPKLARVINMLDRVQRTLTILAGEADARAASQGD